jgi:hypothetical protein
MTTPARAKIRKRPTSAKRNTKNKNIPLVSGRWLTKFPQVKGKTLEDVEFSTHAEDHADYACGGMLSLKPSVMSNK